MKKFTSFALIAILVFGTLIGCTNSTNSANKNEPAASTETSVNTPVDAEKSTALDSAGGEKSNNVLLPVYGRDSQEINSEINFYIEVPEDTAIENKLKIIAEKLSRFKFNRLPINVLEVKTENGKKIAVVNLEEFSMNKGITDPEKVEGDIKSTWVFSYFQGSAGGGSTTETLVQTFLQPEYKGTWIDGVNFLYENKPIDAWEHVSGLAQTVFR